LIQVNCTSIKKQELRKETDLSTFSIDDQKLRFKKAYVYNDICYNSSNPEEVISNCKEVAVEIELYDKELLYNWEISSGLVINAEQVFIINDQKVIGQNQAYLEFHLPDTINLIITNQISDTTNYIDLSCYYDSPPYMYGKSNKYPLPLFRSSLPFRDESYYNSLKVYTDISGHIEKDINDGLFLIKSLDENGNNPTLLKIDVTKNDLVTDSLHLWRFNAYTEADSTWYATTTILKYEKHFLNKEDIVKESNLFKLSGNIGDYSTFRKTIIDRGEVNFYDGIIFEGQIYYIGSTNVY